MRSHRRQDTSSIHSSQQLVPLSLAHDDQFKKFAELVEPSRRRNDLILSQQNFEILDSISEEFKSADVLRRHGLTIRSKLLFCGPPGSGKTVTAEVLAGELGLNLFVARLDALITSFLGETASNLRKMFEAASKQPCILFLDEFDALARAREDRTEHNELRRVVNSLLMMIDRYHGRGLLIAATNLEQSLDLAIWRRFDDVVLFDAPKAAEIKKFLLLKTRNFRPNFLIEKKASKLLGLSYADIERVCFNAIKLSILKKSNHVLEAQFDFSIREELRRQNIRRELKRKLS